MRQKTRHGCGVPSVPHDFCVNNAEGATASGRSGRRTNLFAPRQAVDEMVAHGKPPPDVNVKMVRMLVVRGQCAVASGVEALLDSRPGVFARRRGRRPDGAHARGTRSCSARKCHGSRVRTAACGGQVRSRDSGAEQSGSDGRAREGRQVGVAALKHGLDDGLWVLLGAGRRHRDGLGGAALDALLLLAAEAERRRAVGPEPLVPPRALRAQVRRADLRGGGGCGVKGAPGAWGGASWRVPGRGCRVRANRRPGLSWSCVRVVGVTLAAGHGGEGRLGVAWLTSVHAACLQSSGSRYTRQAS